MNLLASKLLDEKTFYAAFSKDILAAKSEIIIESPFITLKRAKEYVSSFKYLINKGVSIYVITRDPLEHTMDMQDQSEYIIQILERIGVQVLLCEGNDHRKLAMIDRTILYEGSLNILSQGISREIMRRIDDKTITIDMFNFLKLAKYI